MVANPDRRTIRVNWNPPPTNQRNGIITKYTLYWNGNKVSLNSLQYVITGLSPYTRYTLSVSASTSVGMGPRSTAIIVRTLEDGECITDTQCMM